MSRLRRTRRTTVTLIALLVLVGLAAGIASAAIVARVRIPSAKLIMAGIPEKVIALPPARLAQVKEGKLVANIQQLQQNYFVRNNVPFIRGAAGEEFELMPLDMMEYNPTQVEITRATRVLPKILSHIGYINAGAIPTLIPVVVDHRPNQTSVKNQGSRGTCVCFASLAGLEVSYGGGALDLSENYANYLYMKAQSRGCKSAGLKTTDSADYLKAHGVSGETICTYQYSFPTFCNNGATPAPARRTDAESHSPYKIKSFQKIWRNDSLTTDTGIWINNPRYLESLLRAGHDIVFGTHIAGWTSPYTGIIDVQLTGGGNPLPSVGGHAMLVVGYDRNPEYFIVKNSWGTSRGQAGYVYLSYDYIRTYAKYGYVITDVEPILLTMIAPMLHAVPKIRPTLRAVPMILPSK